MNTTDPNCWANYALGLIEEGRVDPAYLVLALVKRMTNEHIEAVLDDNDLTPRFLEEEEEEEEEEDDRRYGDGCIYRRAYLT